LSTTQPLLVYLIHFQAPNWLRSAAESIHRSDIPVELTVVSNSGPIEIDGARIVVTDSNLGYSGAGNVAIADWLETAADFAVIGSHDLHVAPDTLRRLVEAMQREPNIGIAGPRMPDAAQGRRLSEHDYSWISGQCLMLRRRCIEDIGGFDDRFGSYVEDVDLGLRAGDAGWRVTLVPEAMAHGLGSAWGSVRDRRGLRWPNTVGLARKRRGVAAGIRALLAQVLLAALAILRGLRHPRRARSEFLVALDRMRYLPKCVRAFNLFGRVREPSFNDRHRSQTQ
jgi:N-acetylglucosaminyl-diphospho-decaprenol L-rhamnosyltransferase